MFKLFLLINYLFNTVHKTLILLVNAIYILNVFNLVAVCFLHTYEGSYG